MSIFSELVPKINAISDKFTKLFNENLKSALEDLDKYREEEFQNGRNKTRGKRASKKNTMTALQSIDEDEVEPPKLEVKNASAKHTSNSTVRQNSEDNQNETTKEVRASKKRSKHEVEDMSSPEVDKRQKRNASVKAQSVISKQVNINLNEKLRRENTDKTDKNQMAKGRRRKDDEKENLEPNNDMSAVPIVHIKQEKLSLLIEAEPMETESLPMEVAVKQEPKMDDIAMPPPAAPVPRPRKGLAKEKSQQDDSQSDEETGRRRNTRTKKGNDTMPPPPVPASRSTRSSSRVRPEVEADSIPPPDARPKRTRAKKPAEASDSDSLQSQDSLTDPARSRVLTETEVSPLKTRPKRTRRRNKTSEPIVCDDGVITAVDLIGSPAEKPRPKRTRRGRKAAEKEQEVIKQVEAAVYPKEERVSHEEILSPVLPSSDIKTKNKKDTTVTDLTKDARTKELTKTKSGEKELAKTKSQENVSKTAELTKSDSAEKLTKKGTTKELTKTKSNEKELVKSKSGEKELAKPIEKELTKTKSTEKELVKTKSDLTKTKNDSTKTKSDLTKAKSDMTKTKSDLTKGKSELTKAGKDSSKANSIEDTVDNVALDETRVIAKASEMDQTVVLPNGVYNHAPVTPKNRAMNDTTTLACSERKTMVISKPQHAIMDATVVIQTGVKTSDLTEDNSLLTDDNDSVENSPPRAGIPPTQPTSAVKEKVQQFEEMASRVTRTKTRAMAKKEEQSEETHTPPDKISKAVLSTETLTKMNSLIFSGKPPQTSSSACKPRAAVPVKPTTASASKLTAISKFREAAEETLKREDARIKKEALLEAKREHQKRKREEKMAAAAAARSLAERERRAAMEAAARDRMEKQAHADMGKVERMKEAERKKQELARKVAETEERRRAEEAARRLRLAEEQRRAASQRQRQAEEHEAVKREAAIIAKEIEQRQREYNEKQKKQRLEDKTATPFKTPATPGRAPLEPVYMQDGFEYLNSDEEQDPPQRPVPDWCTSKNRQHQLCIQSAVSAVHIERLFSVRVHSPDLRDIFPGIERARIKRTSSAVWRTPDRLPTLAE